MVRASIYYTKAWDPRSDVRIDDLWWELRKEDAAEEPVTMSKSFFEENWAFMGYEEIQTSNPRRDFARIWEKYNVYSQNPLSAENNGQHRVREAGVKHTSMSVGDVIKVRDDYWMAADWGWRKIRFTEESL